jgi:hypothetical protein
MPRAMDNKGLRIALLDTTQKTSAIAIRYGISAGRVRQLRREYGRPYQERLPHGYVSSKRWQSHSEWVTDIQLLRHKEVCAKYGWSVVTVSRMRGQLGIGSRRVVKTTQYRRALKTRPSKEVSAIFNISESAVSVSRRKIGITRAYKHWRNSKRFVTDIMSMDTKTVAKKYNLHITSIYYHRSKLQKLQVFTVSNANQKGTQS